MLRYWGGRLCVPSVLPAGRADQAGTSLVCIDSGVAVFVDSRGMQCKSRMEKCGPVRLALLDSGVVCGVLCDEDVLCCWLHNNKGKYR